MHLLGSLQTKFIALVVATLCFSIGVVTWQSLNDYAQRKLETDLHALARAASARAMANAEQIEADLRFITTTPPFQGVLRALDAQGIDPVDRSTTVQWIGRGDIILNGLLRARPHYAGVRFIIADGTETFRAIRTGGNVPPAPMRDDADFKAALPLAADRLYAGVFTSAESTGIPVIRYAVTVHKDNAVRGVLMIEATAAAVFGAADDSAVAADQYVITQTGAVLRRAGSPTDVEAGAQPPWESLLTKIKERGDGTLRQGGKLYAFAPLFFNPRERNDHWLSIAAIQKRDALRDVGSFGT